MEPVTHLLTGACLARTGFHRRVAYATAAMVVAAEFPDIDTLWSLRGPVAGFEHHRGITHTFLGVPFEAALLLLLVYILDRWRSRRSVRATAPGSDSRVPVRWGALYGLILLALLSHLLLDFTNNYGLRPFFPFNDHWYAASIVFIFDPLMFALLLAGLILPALFQLVNQEMGAGRRAKAAGGWAVAALAGVSVLWAIRTFEHGRAVALAQTTTLRAPATGQEEGSFDAAPSGSSEPPDAAQSAPAPAENRPLLPAGRSLASPDPLSIFRWYAVSDFGPAYRLGVVDSRLGTLEPGRLLIKPEPSATLRAAAATSLGRAYLDWSPMPFLSVDQDDGPAGSEAGPQRTRTVQFSDPRFMGDPPLLHRRGLPPLTGEVILMPADTVLAEGMDGRFDH